MTRFRKATIAFSGLFNSRGLGNLIRLLRVNAFQIYLVLFFLTFIDTVISVKIISLSVFVVILVDVNAIRVVRLNSVLQMNFLTKNC